MIALRDYDFLTPESYLELEENSPVKHEYIDGVVEAMAGTTDSHNTIALNLATLIRNHLRGKECRVYFADLKIRVEEKNCFYYPDLFVTCDPRDRETSTYKCFPKLIIEVLSNSTEAFDRGNKFCDYQILTSLESYVLVSSQQQRVELFSRREERWWQYQNYDQNNPDLSLETIGLDLNIGNIYEDVEL